MHQQKGAGIKEKPYLTFFPKLFKIIPWHYQINLCSLCIYLPCFLKALQQPFKVKHLIHTQLFSGTIHYTLKTFSDSYVPWKKAFENRRGQYCSTCSLSALGELQQLSRCYTQSSVPKFKGLRSQHSEMGVTYSSNGKYQDKALCAIFFRDSVAYLWATGRQTTSHERELTFFDVNCLLSQERRFFFLTISGGLWEENCMLASQLGHRAPGLWRCQAIKQLFWVELSGERVLSGASQFNWL